MRFRTPVKKCNTVNNNIVNYNNINNSTINNTTTTQKILLPSLLQLNARSIFPKHDELSALLSVNPVNLVAITESWLHDEIDDSLLAIHGFIFFRKDRTDGRGGGVCVYVNDVISCNRRLDLENPRFECLGLLYVLDAYLDPCLV